MRGNGGGRISLFSGVPGRPDSGCSFLGMLSLISHDSHLSNVRSVTGLRWVVVPQPESFSPNLSQASPFPISLRNCVTSIGFPRVCEWGVACQDRQFCSPHFPATLQQTGPGAGEQKRGLAILVATQLTLERSPRTTDGTLILKGLQD